MRFELRFTQAGGLYHVADQDTWFYMMAFGLDPQARWSSLASVKEFIQTLPDASRFDVVEVAQA